MGGIVRQGIGDVWVDEERGGRLGVKVVGCPVGSGEICRTVDKIK